MKGSLHTLIYAVVLGIVCALLLTGAARFTEPYRESNAKAEEIRSILSVLGVPFDSKASSQELVTIFENSVGIMNRGKLKMYVSRAREDRGSVKGVAVPFAGPGLWGPIKGFLSLERDMETIRGITFHEQEETPGLGGEIAAACLCAARVQPENCPAWFRHQFKGKRIQDAQGRPGIRIRRDRATGPNEVDAITGATMTSEKVEAMLNALIRELVEERDSDG